jgi:hypothetical protein
MDEFVQLSCPVCGAPLRITGDLDRLTCGHCGTEHVARRALGSVSLEPILKRLDRVERQIDTQAIQIQVARLEKEIVELKRKLDGTYTGHSSAALRTRWVGIAAIALLAVAWIVAEVASLAVAVAVYVVATVGLILAAGVVQLILSAERRRLSSAIAVKEEELDELRGGPRIRTYRNQD